MGEAMALPPPPDSAPVAPSPYQQHSSFRSAHPAASAAADSSPSSSPSPPPWPSSASPALSSPFPRLAPRPAARTTARPPAPTSPAPPALEGPHLPTPPRLDTSVATSADAGPSSATSLCPGDIEMDPIAPAGHRRRRSSLMNPPNATSSSGGGGPRTGRPRGQSVHHDEPKIDEEAGGDDADLPRRSGVEPLPLPTADDDGSLSDEDLHDDEETGLTKKDRRRKQKRRRRNTLLDQRIARDNITDEERKEADQSVARKLAVNGTLIGLWYLFSLSISLYNKWMFDDQKLNFPFPLFTTAIHMMVQFTLSSLVLYFVPSLRPRHPAGHRSDLGQSRHEAESQPPIMTKLFYLTRIGPCGAATGLDIGLGNTSLKFITLTFYTMCKSSSLAFVLIFAFLFRLETPTWKLIGIIGTMTAGVVMMVAGEVEFKLGGFLLVISAAFFSGFRWGLTQILLLRNPATSNPFSSIFFLAPVMFLTLICIAIPVEGFPALLEGLRGLGAEWGVMVAPFLVLFPGTIAFLMTASEFALLQRTSVVTLSIAGIFKEVVTISAAALVFDDRLTPINISGLLITIAAIASYNYIKIATMREEARRDVHRGHHAAAAEASSSGSGSGSDVDGDDDDDDAAGEEAGLLQRQSVDENVVTLDGDFIPAGLVEDGKPHEHKSGRDD